MEVTINGLPFDSKYTIDPETNRKIYDRVAFSRDVRNVFGNLISNGVVLHGTNILADEFRVMQGTGMQVNVQIGQCVINGGFGWIDSPVSLPIAVGGAQARIDRVVVEMNIVEEIRAFRLRVLQGTPAASPQPPPLLRTEDVWQLSLAQVRVNAGQSTIASITSERHDPSLCGIANVQIGVALPDDVDILFETLLEQRFSGFVAPTSYRNMLAVTASRNWTVPAGVTQIGAFLVGGGQGGGSGGRGGAGGSAVNSGSGGNGAEAVLVETIPVTPGQVLNLTVGAGGAGQHQLPNHWQDYPGFHGGQTSIERGGTTLVFARNSDRGHNVFAPQEPHHGLLFRGFNRWSQIGYCGRGDRGGGAGGGWQGGESGGAGGGGASSEHSASEGTPTHTIRPATSGLPNTPFVVGAPVGQTGGDVVAITNGFHSGRGGDAAPNSGSGGGGGGRRIFNTWSTIGSTGNGGAGGNGGSGLIILYW